MKIHELKLCESWINLDLPPDFAGLIYAATLLDDGQVFVYDTVLEQFREIKHKYIYSTFGKNLEEIMANYSYIRDNLHEILIISDLIDPALENSEADISIRILDDGKDEVCGKIKQKYSYEGDL